MKLMTLTLAALAIGVCACASGPPEPPERIIYLAIGASDAAGVGAEPLTKGYVYRIADELDQRVDQVFLAPLAIPGAGTEQLGAALELLLKSEVEPNLVTVWTGANDVIDGEDADDFKDDLEDIFDQLRERTDGVIVAANIPDLTELPRFREHPDDDVTHKRIKEFNKAIAELAEDYDVLVVDLYSEPVEDQLVSDKDGFHPNDAGHQRIAEAFLAVILPALGLAPTA